MSVEYKYYDEEKTKMKLEDYTDENGDTHRTDGPAFIRYREDGSVQFGSYFINGNRHRTDGPSRIWYREDGRVEREEYWIHNGELTKKQWEVHPEVIAALVTKNVGE